MKRSVVWSVLVFVLWLLLFSVVLADTHNLESEEKDIVPASKSSSDEEVSVSQKNSDLSSGLKDGFSQSVNEWNQTVQLPEQWQGVFSVFFGFNLKDEGAISFREAIVFIMIFVLFFVIVYDLFKIAPYFKGRFLGVRNEFFASFVLTLVFSILGVFVSLKNVLLSSLSAFVDFLDWQWLNDLVASGSGGILITFFVIIPLFLLLRESLSWFVLWVKKRAQISKAAAQGRMVGNAVAMGKAQSSG